MFSMCFAVFALFSLFSVAGCRKLISGLVFGSQQRKTRKTMKATKTMQTQRKTLKNMFFIVFCRLGCHCCYLFVLCFPFVAALQNEFLLWRPYKMVLAVTALPKNRKNRRGQKQLQEKATKNVPDLSERPHLKKRQAHPTSSRVEWPPRRQNKNLGFCQG